MKKTDLTVAMDVKKVVEVFWFEKQFSEESFPEKTGSHWNAKGFECLCSDLKTVSDTESRRNH